jgi:hypothetical protein
MDHTQKNLSRFVALRFDMVFYFLFEACGLARLRLYRLTRSFFNRYQVVVGIQHLNHTPGSRA